jgi:hypothetical protein
LIHAAIKFFGVKGADLLTAEWLQFMGHKQWPPALFNVELEPATKLNLKLQI